MVLLEGFKNKKINGIQLDIVRVIPEIVWTSGHSAFVFIPEDFWTSNYSASVIVPKIAWTGDAFNIKQTQTPPLNATAGNMIRYFIKRARLQKRQAVGQLRDLLVIVDSSGSITPEGFAIGKKQLSRLLGMLCPVPNPFDSNYQRAALLQYSSTVQEIFDFNDKPSTNLVQQGINSMIYDAGITCTGDAFNYAYNNMFTTAKGMRTSPDVKQEVLIITDGQSNCGVNAIAAAANLQTKADVFGLMIGYHTPAGEAELTSYVSYPINTHLFAINGMQDLEQLVNLIDSQLSTVPCAPFDL
ncbi:cartilage matrix protein-like [Dreissena polymorpha]|uniref:cartilage matrix protein-like n=1 Tax=Dreissena polymorpha TaxID=45954 RepID=UPI0022647352|nr:cartilage matrix protein-like [Dreissena polymorpha]